MPWTVHCEEDERLTLSGFFEKVVARSDDTIQAHLSDHKLEEARVGSSKDTLDTVSDTGMFRLEYILLKMLYECLVCIYNSYL